MTTDQRKSTLSRYFVVQTGFAVRIFDAWYLEIDNPKNLARTIPTRHSSLVEIDPESTKSFCCVITNRGTFSNDHSLLAVQDMSAKNTILTGITHTFRWTYMLASKRAPHSNATSCFLVAADLTKCRDPILADDWHQLSLGGFDILVQKKPNSLNGKQ